MRRVPHFEQAGFQDSRPQGASGPSPRQLAGSVSSQAGRSSGSFLGAGPTAPPTRPQLLTFGSLSPWHEGSRGQWISGVQSRVSCATFRMGGVPGRSTPPARCFLESSGSFAGVWPTRPLIPRVYIPRPVAKGFPESAVWAVFGGPPSAGTVFCFLGFEHVRLALLLVQAGFHDSRPQGACASEPKAACRSSAPRRSVLQESGAPVTVVSRISLPSPVLTVRVY